MSRTLTGIAGIVVAVGLVASSPVFAEPICHDEFKDVMKEAVENEKRGMFGKGIYNYKIKVGWDEKLSEVKISCLQRLVTTETNGNYTFVERNIYGTLVYYLERLKKD